MSLSIDNLVELLNQDLELEYFAAIQYMNHSSLMTGDDFYHIKDELNTHAKEEIRHVMILADQITYQGGIPSVSIGEIKIARDNKDMLKQDLAGEEYAIRRYTVRIQQAENLKEFALAGQLRNILEKEQVHARDIKLALGL